VIRAIALLASYFLGVPFVPEDEGSKFLRNFGELLAGYSLSHPPKMVPFIVIKMARADDRKTTVDRSTYRQN
jgi:hypothetical protein